MGLETNPETIEDLNPLWPLETDPLTEGNEHLQNIKSVLQKVFGITGTPGTVWDAIPFHSETLGTTSGTSPAITIDTQSGNYFPYTMTEDTVFTFAGATDGNATSFVLDLTGSANFIATFTDVATWGGSALPTPTGRDLFVFVTLDGVTWYGVYITSLGVPA